MAWKSSHIDPSFLPWILLWLSLGMNACIDEYSPDKEELRIGTLVVSAHLSDLPGPQVVTVSRSTSLRYPSYDPQSHCQVQLVSSTGEVRVFEEGEAGSYACDPGEGYFQSGEAYQLQCITPEGEAYGSSWETFHPALEIDDLTWQREVREAANPEDAMDGILFSLDFTVPDDGRSFLRWEMVETWEIRNPRFQVLRYDVDRVWTTLPDSSLYLHCWITDPLPDIVTRDLRLLSPGPYRGVSLNYVSNRTRRLALGYSLLVRQYTLSEGAHAYWSELAKNSKGNSDFFSTQPSLARGNVCNLSDPEEVVLGYFSVSGCSERRCFVREVPDLVLPDPSDECRLEKPPQGFFFFVRYFADNSLPVFAGRELSDPLGPMMCLENECADCRYYENSSPVPPGYWDENR
ncbi:MAG: DUF4249 domain-containing protein [Bacteroidales bacterium]